MSSPFKPRLLVRSRLLLCAGLLISGCSSPSKNSAQTQTSLAEAKQYVPNLMLSDVSMQATENFMKQQVIEVQGKLTNNGRRNLELVEVYCLFYNIDGRELHRERAAIVKAKANPVRSGETRAFRLPFDSLPEGWNQAMPKLVIANIAFAS